MGRIGAATAARMSHVESPTYQHSADATPSRSAASRSRSGAGLALATALPSTTVGSRSSARAPMDAETCSARDEVAIAQVMPAASRRASASLAPGSGRGWRLRSSKSDPGASIDLLREPRGAGAEDLARQANPIHADHRAKALSIDVDPSLGECRLPGLDTGEHGVHQRSIEIEHDRCGPGWVAHGLTIDAILRLMTSRVAVIGSINVDLVVSVDHLPEPGETVGEGRFATHDGGKGANQAVAAARAGAEVAIIGAVGADGYGARAVSALSAAGIDVSRVRLLDEQATGVAIIAVGPRGENQIAVAPGANAAIELTEDDLAVIASADVLLVSHEVPQAAILAGLRAASEAGRIGILNPAPARALPADVLAIGPILTPNEHELIVAIGNDDTAAALDELATRNARTGDRHPGPGRCPARRWRPTRAIRRDSGRARRRHDGGGRRVLRRARGLAGRRRVAR